MFQGQHASVQICLVTHLPAHLAEDSALDIFQKHQEKEMEKRQQTYW
jgi:hypothetical protein